MQSARAYFELAHLTIRPPAPTLVAVGGLSGTGKSVLARALAPVVTPSPGAVVLRTDVLRKQQFQLNETDRLPKSAYQPEITAQIYEVLVQRAARILVQGHSVVVDAVFAHETERAAICDAARKLNIRFVGLFLATDLATRLSRVGRRERDASDATPEIAEIQEKYNIGAVDWAVIDASGTPEQTLKQCQTQIAHVIRQKPKRETAMSPSPKSRSFRPRARAETGPAGRHRQISRLNPMMACDTAFRVVARRYLGDLTANHEATCKGDPVALHQMRIALTRLRTAILFFSPMVVDTQRRANKGRTEVAEHPSWRRARSGRRDRAAAGRRQTAAAGQYPTIGHGP